MISNHASPRSCHALRACSSLVVVLLVVIIVCTGSCRAQLLCGLLLLVPGSPPAFRGCPCLSLSIISFCTAKVLISIDISKYFLPSIVRFVNTYRPICQYIADASSRGFGRAPAPPPAPPVGRGWRGCASRDPRAPGARRRGVKPTRPRAPPPRPPTYRVAFTFRLASWFPSAHCAATPDAPRKG